MLLPDNNSSSSYVSYVPTLQPSPVPTPIPSSLSPTFLPLINHHDHHENDSNDDSQSATRGIVVAFTFVGLLILAFVLSRRKRESFRIPLLGGGGGYHQQQQNARGEDGGFFDQELASFGALPYQPPLIHGDTAIIGADDDQLLQGQRRWVSEEGDDDADDEFGLCDSVAEIEEQGE